MVGPMDLDKAEAEKQLPTRKNGVSPYSHALFLLGRLVRKRFSLLWAGMDTFIEAVGNTDI